MNKKVIIILLTILAVLMLSIGLYGLLTNKKEKTLIDDVQTIYSNALVKYNESKIDLYSNLSSEDTKIDNVNENLSYMVKFNNSGEIIYLVVSNGVERFQIGSLYDNKAIKLEDITPEKIVKDETIVVEEKKNKIEYEIIDSGSNSSYVSNGYFVDSNNNVTITLGKKNSGSYKINVVDVYANDDEITIVIDVDEPTGDYQIQVMSYPYITVKLKTDKIGTINVKKTDGSDFKIFDELNTEIKDAELIKKDTEEKIKSIVIEKKEVTENDLEKLDQDSDGKITIKDAEIVKSKTDEDSEIIDSQTKVCKAGEYLKNNKCVSCPNNTYSTNGEKCLTCPVDTCTSGGAKSIKECKPCAGLIDPVKPELVTE